MLRGVTLVSWNHQGGRARMFKFSAFWGGIIWAFTSTAFICAALVLWAFITGGEVYHFSGICTAGILLGAFLGGAVSGRVAGSPGWLHGAAVGIVYCLAIIAFFTAWGGGFSALTARVLLYPALFVLAVTGGIVGVNLPAAGRIREKYRPPLR
ncbi:TIGR04086 family membrane protein [Desulfallas sp. Bu1-1]|uniref:TIGR04086 family membrane protein n=1 Tax=Desulfallas sp. Bu1-1 TaxID=2787620 RepID=UPI00189DDE83|nr:TIGR04086 family membrane protein [Desulfallas sp. Bu1-1]MBF7083730.1 TIGR04086 family membrane protein [Desulfallas sp. Bu1-1]